MGVSCFLRCVLRSLCLLSHAAFPLSSTFCVCVCFASVASLVALCLLDVQCWVVTLCLAPSSPGGLARPWRSRAGAVLCTVRVAFVLLPGRTVCSAVMSGLLRVLGSLLWGFPFFFLHHFTPFIPFVSHSNFCSFFFFFLSSSSALKRVYKALTTVTGFLLSNCPLTHHRHTFLTPLYALGRFFQYLLLVCSSHCQLTSAVRVVQFPLYSRYSATRSRLF